MRRITDVLDSLSPRMVRLEAYAIEVELSFCSLWAAWVLLVAEGWSDVINANSAFVLTANFGSQTIWGSVAFIGATAKLTGLLLSRTHFSGLVLMLRIGGLWISGTFWLILGLAAVGGHPHSLFGVPIILLGVSAWWVLIRFPTLPGSASELLK
jgi:hypothetical protein